MYVSLPIFQIYPSPLPLQFSAVQSLSHVRLFATPWTEAQQASQSIIKLPCPELAQTRVHWVGDAIQTSHPLSRPLFPPSIFPAIRTFSDESVLLTSGQSIGMSAIASVIPMNIQDWFPLAFSGLNPKRSRVLSPRDSQESSPTPQFKSIKSLALSFLYSPTLTSIHDYRKNHSFDQTDLCWPSNVSAF